MKPKIKRPLLENSHLPMYLLGGAMTFFGLVSAIIWTISSRQAMRGVISVGQLRTRLSNFVSIGGLIAGISFLALFVWCIMSTKKPFRAAFIIGGIASFAPILAAHSETLLFGVLGLRLPAGSVIADALTTIIFALPMIVFFIILASSKQAPCACRWSSVVGILAVLGTAFFPIYVTVLAFLVRPGDPAVGKMMEISSQVIKMRYIFPGLIIILLAYLSSRFHPDLAVRDENAISS
jgi:hypothetical protein